MLARAGVSSELSVDDYLIEGILEFDSQAHRNARGILFFFFLFFLFIRVLLEVRGQDSCWRPRIRGESGGEVTNVVVSNVVAISTAKVLSRATEATKSDVEQLLYW